MDEEILSQTIPQNNFNFKNLLSIRNITILFITLTLINLIYIDIVTLRNPKTTIVEKVINITKPPDSPQTSSVILTDQVCPQTCIAQIYEATVSSRMQPTTMPTITPTITPTISSAPEGISTVKEFFIPFGSGSSTAGDWQDVQGIQATIDTANFPGLKSVTFEATVRIPTGNEVAYIRLYNVTDKHPIWFSEISLEGGTPKLLISRPIILDSGSKLYQVQMKTSLKFQAIFDQARLHIITN